MTFIYILTILGWLGFGWMLYCRLSDIRCRKVASQTPTNRQTSPALPPTLLAGFPEKLSDWDRNLMAYHEAGHAIVSMYMPERKPVIKVTINPSEQGFGCTQTETREFFNDTFVSLSSAVTVMLAGRLSEQMFCKEITTSCVHDLIQANRIAKDMVLRFAMGKQTGFFQPDDQSSETFRRQADEDVQDILCTAQEMATTILKEHAQQVHQLAKELLEKGTVEQMENGKWKMIRGCENCLVYMKCW